MRYRSTVLSLLTIIVCVFCNTTVASTDENALWRLINQGGYVALLRHALAPGFGDPEYFAVDDCSTQRNLDDVGRKQASDIGERFRQNGIRQAQVFSSQWCRCLDTARLLGLGEVTELPVLNSFFQHFERRDEQTNDLKRWLQSHDVSKPILLVTHQVNITALTGVVPDSGEMVVISLSDAGDVTVQGTLTTDY